MNFETQALQYCVSDEWFSGLEVIQIVLLIYIVYLTLASSLEGLGSS